MGHESRTRLVTAMVLAAVFSAGALMGAVADNRLGADEPDAPAVAPAPEEESANEPEEERRGPTYLEVEPNEEQLALIEQIVAEHRARRDALEDMHLEAYRADFRVILMETRVAIKGVLTPEQAERYQQLLDERYPPADGSENDDDQR